MNLKTWDLDCEWIERATATVDYEDAAGIRQTLAWGQTAAGLQLTPRLTRLGEHEVLLELEVRNGGSNAVRLHALTPFAVALSYGGALEFEGLPGSWTWLGYEGLRVRLYDLCHPPGEFRPPRYSASHFALLGRRASRRYLACGFLDFQRQGGGEILLDLDRFRRFVALRAFCPADGYPLAPGETWQSDPLYLNFGAAFETALGCYIGRLQTRFPPAERARAPVSGWSSWDYYQGRVTEEDVLENARWLADHRADVPVDIIQIDHGFQAREGDWLETNERFPHGLPWLARELQSLGFKPGLWLCPLLLAADSRVFREHPEWALRAVGGGLLKVSGYAVRTVHALDASVPEARDWLHDLGAKVRALGFEYVKLDGANFQPLMAPARPRDPRLTRARAVRLGLEAFRRGYGEDRLLQFSGGFGVALGLADAVRISDDVGARWDGTRIARDYGERDNYPGPGYVHRCLSGALNAAFKHRRLWINDPDFLIVRPRGDRSELTYREARTWATVVAMTGGLAMLSDRMSHLPATRLNLIRKVLPPLEHRAHIPDFFEKEVPCLCFMSVGHAGGSWRLAAVINGETPERTRSYRLPLAEEGQDPDTPFHVFDFWNRAYLGVHRRALPIEDLAARDCRLLAVVEQRAEPQVIGTDMHFSQGAVELQDVRYDAQADVLILCTRACGKRGRVYVHVPEGFELGKGPVAARKGVAAIPVTADGRTLRVAFQRTRQPG